MQLARADGVEAQQTAERHVDLGDLAHVERIAQAAQLHQLGLAQRVGSLGGERGPTLPVDLVERARLARESVARCARLGHRPHSTPAGHPSFVTGPPRREP